MVLAVVLVVLFCCSSMDFPPSSLSYELARLSSSLAVRFSESASLTLCQRVVVLLLSVTFTMTAHSSSELFTPIWLMILIVCCCPSKLMMFSDLVFLLDLHVQSTDLLQVTTEMNSFTTLLKVMVWPLCSAILSRSDPRVFGRVALHPSLKFSQVSTKELRPLLEKFKLRLNTIAMVGWVQLRLVSPLWKCSSISKLQFCKFGLLETFSGLKTDEYYSFKERGFSSFSSLWERSIPPSFDTERTASSPPYSFAEEIFGVQPQILPLLVDIILTGFKTRFLPNSTMFEPNLQFDLIASVRLHHSSETHVGFYEILQVLRNLKKCSIFTFGFHSNLCTRLIICFSGRVFKLNLSFVLGMFN